MMVEARLVVRMAKTIIYPAATRYLTDLAASATSLAAVGVELDKATVVKIAAEIKAMMDCVSELSAAVEKEDFATEEDHLRFCAATIRGLMDQTRVHADALEAEVADDLWPLPTYQEMLFIK